MRYTTYQQTPWNFTLTPWVKRLLVANVAVFLVTMVDRDLFFRWFAFAPSEFLTRPWGAFTYMFLHGDFWHLFMNMLVLFFFGPPLESRWGSREFLKYYFLCGLGGVALSFLFASYWIVGASAAIYGLMLAFALNWPNAPIYIWGIFPVKAKWLVGFLFAVSLMSAFGGAAGGIAHFAHLGGIVTGFFYLKSDWRPDLSRKAKRKAAAERRLAIVPREEPRREAHSKASRPSERPAREESLLDEVDRILDKISASGIASLTSKERETLDEVSRRHRSN
jgi:membrane associated rhomboid family serine protease